MQLTLPQLDTHLKNALSRIYLMSGDETFLVEESRNKIIATAQSRGFSERAIFHIETGFAWENIFLETQNHSLFSEKKIIDIRNPDAKMDASLITLIENADESHLFLITTNKLTGAQQKSKWFSTFNHIGAYLLIWPIELAALPSWIMAKAKQYHLQIDRESATWLAECTQGNLSATAQAIEKLTLLYPKQMITSKEMADVLVDNAKFKLFDFIRYLLLGDANKVIKIISIFEKEQELPFILWAITKEIRELMVLQHRIRQGISMQQALSSTWSFKKPLLQYALKNTSIDLLNEALLLAAKIDRLFKSFQVTPAWENITTLCLLLCRKK